MSFDTQQESLSAVMDDEADELELRRVLANSEDTEVRAKWTRYQIARAAMHKELRVPELDLTQGINAALDQANAPASRGIWHTVGRVAIAASVTLAVLAGVRLYHDNHLANEHLAKNQQPSSLSVQEPAVLVGFSEQQATPAKPAVAEEQDLLNKEPVQR